MNPEIASIEHLNRNRPRKNGRSGAILIAVLVVLGVVSAMLLAAVTASVKQRRQLRQELQLEQTRWVVDAGVRKAILDIQSGRKVDQVLELGDVFDNLDLAVLKIESNKAEDSDQPATITVSAELSAKKESAFKTKRSFKFNIE